MTTVDKILLKILNEPNSLDSLASRDVKVLNSLAKIVITQSFITANQGQLLIKILKENCSKFGSLAEELATCLTAPGWTRPFRPIDKTKKMYLDNREPGIIIEFAFSSTIKKVLSNGYKNVSGLVQVVPGKQYRADLTEQNIIELVDLLKPCEFEIEEKIQLFYDTIHSWSELEVRNQFLLTNISHTNFQKHITADLGINTAIDQNIINDRAVRYQYFVEKPEKIAESLVEKIANRSTTKVWVNKQEVGLEEIFASLIKLKRLPALVIFEPNDQKRCLEDLKKLHESLEKNGIFNSIGIYFRLPNDDTGVQFNKFIAEHQYNAQLDNMTKIVGVQNGKIPKFFIKNNWKPMSVISVGNSLRNTKTAVYANSCDLIISYTDIEPIIDSGNLWL
jgi:hypothetical protein